MYGSYCGGNEGSSIIYLLPPDMTNNMKQKQMDKERGAVGE